MTVPKIKASDVIEISSSTGMTQDIIEILDEYFSVFQPAAYENGVRVCPHCRKENDAFKQLVGLGVAWEWDVVHGEARCSGCHWPARGHHYIKGKNGECLISITNFFFAYHPDCVERKDDAT